MLVRAMRDDDVEIWGDGSTFKGNDIERFYRYGLLANPELRIYKPWLDAASSASSAAATRCASGSPRTTCPTATRAEKAYSTDANIWGATHEAKPLEHLDVSMEIVEPIMGVRFWDPAVAIDPEDVTIRFEAAGRSPSTAAVRRRRPCAGPRGQRDRRPARARHVRPDREPHHRGQVPRHLRGARHGAAVHRLRAAAQRHPQRGHARQLPRPGPPPRSAAVRGPLARPAGADAARVAAALDRVAVTGEVTVRLRRGEDYTIMRTAAPTFSYHPDQLSMERIENAAFGPTDRIGQLTMRNLDIADSREKLELYAAQPLDEGRSWSSTASSSVRCRPAVPTDRGQPGPRGQRRRRGPRQRRHGVRHRLTPSRREGTWKCAESARRDTRSRRVGR